MTRILLVALVLVVSACNVVFAISPDKYFVFVDIATPFPTNTPEATPTRETHFVTSTPLPTFTPSPTATPIIPPNPICTIKRGYNANLRAMPSRTALVLVSVPELKPVEWLTRGRVVAENETWYAVAYFDDKGKEYLGMMANWLLVCPQ